MPLLGTIRFSYRATGRIAALVAVFAFLVLTALPAPPARAATGINEQINYQGRLLTAAGRIAPDGMYNMEFKVYQDGTGCVAGGTSPCGGTLKWTEDWVYGSGSPDNRVRVVNGYFSVRLGSVNAFGSSVDWNQSVLWISMNIGNTSTAATFGAAGGDGEMVPFKRLAAAPYAMQAKNAGTLGGLTTGDFIRNQTTTQANANFNIQSAASGSIGGIIQGASGQTADLFRLQNSAASNLLAVSATGAATFKNSTNSTAALSVQNASGATALVVDTTNMSVGINTTATTNAQLNVTAAGGRGIYVTTTGSFGDASNQSFYGVNAAGTSDVLLTARNADAVVGTTKNQPLILETNGASRVNISGTGNIVIGAADTIGNLLTLDTKTNTGDPAGTDGSMYYNSNAAKFRCYQNGAWADCLNLGSYINNGTTLQPTANFNIQSAAAGSVGGAIQGATGQTADLLQLKNPAGTPVATVSAAGALAISSGGQAITLNGPTSNYINYGNTAGSAAPTFTTRSVGTKIVLWDGLTGSSVDYAIGIDVNTLWNSVPTTAQSFKWYGGTTNIATLTGTGNLTLGATGTGTLTSGLINGQTISSAANFTGTVNVATGYQIGGTAVAGTFLRGNGTNYVASLIQAADLPAGSGNYINNQTTTQASANFNIQSAATTSVGGVIQGAVSQTADLLDLRNSAAVNLFSVSATGNTTVHTTNTDSTTAFQVQNSAGTAVANISTQTTNPNLIANPDVENNLTGYTARGAATISQVGSTVTAPKFGSYSLKAATTAAANDGVQYAYPLLPSTQYSLSFWAKLDAGTASTITAGRFETSADTTCTLNSTAFTTTWTNYTCTFTTGATIDQTSNIFIKQTDATARILYVDGVYLNAGATPQTFVTDATNLQVDPLYSQISLNGSNSGEVGPWQRGTNLPVNIFYVTPVVANGYVYVIGGATAPGVGTTVPNVYYSKLNSDGSNGSWTLSSTPLPAPRYSSTAVYYNGYIYVMGGSDTNGYTQSTVYYSKVNPDGSNGAWQTGNPLPEARTYHNSVAANGYVYIIGGSSDTAYKATVFFAKMNSDGSLGSWNTTTSLPGSRAYSTSVTANGYIYVLGGHDGSIAQNTVLYGKLNSDGTISSWAPTNTLPTAGYLGTSAVANGYIYEMGHNNNLVYYAKLNANGTTGLWNTSTSHIPATRWLAGTVLYNNYLYEIGGSGNGGGTAVSTTYYTSLARTQMGGSLDLVGLSDGDTSAVGGIGGALTAGNTTVVGTLDVRDSATFSQGAAVGGNLSVAGDAAIHGTTLSQSSFAIQDVAGSKAVNVANGAPVNLLTNGNFENGAGVVPPGWFRNMGTETTFEASSDTAKFGGLSLKIINPAAAGSYGAYYRPANLRPNTTYALSVYARVASGSISSFYMGSNVNGVGAFCLMNQTLTTTWTRFSCSFTTGATVSVGDSVGFNIYESTPITLYLDGAQLEYGNSPSAYVDPTPTNLVANSSFEQNKNGWTAKGSATVSQDTSMQPQFGTGTLKIVTTAAANDGAAYLYALQPYTTYSMSFWAKGAATYTNFFNFGRNENGSDSNCLVNGVANQTLTTTWTQYNCTFTTGATINTTPGIYIKQNNAAAQTAYIDGVTLVAGLAPQAYVSPGSNVQVDPLYSQISLNGGNSGEVEPWQNTTALPQGRYDPRSAIANGYMYIVGGYYSAAAQNTVIYAKINNDGTLGSWQNANPVPVARYQERVVAANGYLYAIGGDTQVVYYAKLNADGTIGAWQTSPNSIPSTNVGIIAATTMNGYIYVAGGTVASSSVVYTKLNADGSTGPWLTTTSMPSPGRRGASLGVGNGYLYITGGYDGSANLADVDYAKPNADGSISSWSSANNLPDANVLNHDTVVANGYMYVISLTGSVYYAKLNADGTTGVWNVAYNKIRTGQYDAATTSINNGYLYLIGGGPSATPYNTAYYASLPRTTVGGSLDLVGLADGSLSDVGGTGGSLTAGNTTVVGTFDVRDTASFSQGVNVGGNLAVSSDVAIGSTTESLSTFSVQTMAGNNSITVGSGAPTNLVFNPSFEQNADGWSAKGASVVTATNEIQTAYGNRTLKIVTTAATNDGAKYAYTFQPSTTYTMSFNVIGAAAYASFFEVGWDGNGSDANCLVNGVADQTVNTYWTSYTCTFTTGATIGSTPYIYIKQNNAAARTVYIDGITLVAGSKPLAYAAPGASLSVDPLYSQIAINGGYSGEVAPWQTTTPLPSINRSFGSVAANGYVYALGGYDTGGVKATVSYSRLSADGSLGSWQSTTVLPAARTNFGSVAANGYVYVIGGHTSALGYSATTYYAKLNADGTVGTWLTGNSLPAARVNPGAVVANGYVYIIGGYDGLASPRQSTVYYAKLNVDGSVGAWQTSTALPSGRAAAGAVVANGYVYIVGGSSDNTTYQNTVLYAKLNADGSVGVWQSGTVLPVAMNFQTMAVQNGYMYNIGGTNGSSQYSTVYYSKLNSNGSIDAWNTAINALPGLRASPSSVVTNGYVYVLGGTADLSTSINTVYYTSFARTLIGGSLDLVGASDGDTSAVGGTGASLTAGNTTIVGTLDVRDNANFSQGAAVGGQMSVGEDVGTGGFWRNGYGGSSGANLIPISADAWRSSTAMWRYTDIAATTSVVDPPVGADKVPTGKVHQFINPGVRSVAYIDQYIAIDPDKTYYGQIWAARIAGTGTFFAGYIAYDKDKNVIPGNTGSFGYFIAAGVTPAATGTWYYGQIGGEGAAMTNFPVGTRYIEPMIITNYPATGTMQVGGFEISDRPFERATGAWSLATAGTDRIAIDAGANITLSGASAVNLKTTSGNIVLGTSDTTGNQLVLDTKTDAGDPASGVTNGGMYYNSAMHQFRCYRDSAWETCGVNPIDRGYTIEDEFMSGNMQSGYLNGTLGAAGWTNLVIGTGADFGSNGATFGATPTVDRPGILNIRPLASSGAGTYLALNGRSSTSNGSVVLTAGQSMKSAVAFSQAYTASNLWGAVGLTNYVVGTGVTTGAYWQASSGSAFWQYCYVNATPTVVCANSGVGVAAGTFVTVGIKINSLGTGTSSITFTINGTSTTVSSVTLNTTNRVNPAIYSELLGATTGIFNVDYYQFSGIASAQR